MDVGGLFSAITTQQQAVSYLESLRWNGEPRCPYCESVNVGRHASGDREGHRWQCHPCNRVFSASVGTIFHRTHVPLRSWFLVIALALREGRKGSTAQLARDLGMRRATVALMIKRIDGGLANHSHAPLIRAIASGVRSPASRTRAAG